MIITDLNTFCIEHIMRNLELKDLLNVADTNKCMRSVAESVFKFKYMYKKKPIDINSYAGGLLIYYHSTRMTTRHENLAHPLKSSLQKLRCFGHLLNTLRIYIWKEYDRTFFARFIAYVGKYCAETLKVIHIVSINGRTVLTHLKKPLLNVEQVCIKGCRLQKNWLSKMFPKLRILTACNEDLNFIGIENHFPNLENLNIRPKSVERSTKLSAQILKVLCLNPQLRILSIPLLAEAKFLHFISLNMPHLTDLTINEVSKAFQNYNGPSYHLGNLQKYGIGYIPRHLGSILLPFSFGPNLEEINIEYFNTSNEQSLSDFARKYRTIRKLSMTIEGVTPEGATELIPRIVQAFPSLRQFGVSLNPLALNRQKHAITKENATKIMKRCATLKRYEEKPDGKLRQWFYAQ